MNKFRNTQKRKTDTPTRQNSGFSIKKESISAPIPKVEDDEFPIRTPGAGIASPLGTEAHERQFRPRESPVKEVDNEAHQDGTVTAESEESAVRAQSTSIPSQLSNEYPSKPIEPPRSRSRASIASVRSSSSIRKHQRKKSSLRSVFGKIFGRKRKDSASPHSKRTGSTDFRGSQHRSDPIVLNRTPPGRSGTQQRSASLPIDEFNRALRSHSVIDEEFPLRSSTYEPNRDSIQADGHARPRRATNPSRLWEPNRTGDWTGLTPRPASSHARGSRIISASEADEAVGIAVTSGSHPNRRSRSLSELRKDMQFHAVSRRRSDEIRYWRESYDQGLLSPLSSNKADAEDEPVFQDAAETPPVDVAYDPPQPFNFGPLGVMAGMKITQAASLETRVMHLEERLLKMERTMSRIQYDSSTEVVQFQDPPLRNPSRISSASALRPATGNSDISLPKHHTYQDSPPRTTRQEATVRGSQFRSSSYGSNRPSTWSNNNHSQTNDTILPPQFSPVDENTASSQSNSTRPLSVSTTIRGVPSSSPTFSKVSPSTSEHFANLTNLIITEQAARQNLETIVYKLQRQLSSYVSSHQPSHPTAGGGYPNFSRNESDDEELGDTGYAEDFRTPAEESGVFGDEIFGENMNDKVGDSANGKVKTAPRTLSLSQITLGKGAQQQIGMSF